MCDKIADLCWLCQVIIILLRKHYNFNFQVIKLTWVKKKKHANYSYLICPIFNHINMTHNIHVLWIRLLELHAFLNLNSCSLVPQKQESLRKLVPLQIFPLRKLVPWKTNTAWFVIGSHFFQIFLWLVKLLRPHFVF